MSLWEPAGKVDVLHVLETLEIDNVRREGLHEARFSCPYPGHENGDISASAYMNLESCNWYCHGCKRKGSVIKFVASMLNISPIKAKRLLRQAYDPASLDPDDRSITNEIHEFFAKRENEVVPENTPLDDSLIEDFAVDWQAVAEAGDDAPEEFLYMLSRGFSPETLEHWGFGYDHHTNRIVFPVRDEYDRIVGFKGRATDGRHPKYLVIGDAPDKPPRYGIPRYYTGQVVFGLGEAVHAIEALDAGEESHLIVCEGELNAIALWQMGYTNAVALNGSNLTSHQAQLIRAFADRVTFFFDFDKAGLRGMWGWDDEETGEHHDGALEVLSRDLVVRLVGSHDDDPAGMLENGCESEVDRLVREAESFTVASLRRRLVTSHPHR